MRTTVTKFGGSSLADADQFRKVADIIKADSARRFVVASAPGKRSSDDVKVTDMLYRCYEAASAGEDYSAQLAQISKRFTDIAQALNVEFDVDSELKVIAETLAAGTTRDYMASRGEYLNSRLLAAFLGYKFIDAADVIFFKPDGTLDEKKTYRVLPQAIKGVRNAVIPGFYGSASDGSIKTFSRGGSDVTGAIVAHAADADIYENWTDVSGMLMADPRVIDNPKPISFISYRELRELSYSGASVLHEEAVFPARSLGIPINIRNTNRPSDPGTMITKAVPPQATENDITGIAGSKGFCSILIEKAMMNSEIGFTCKILEIFRDYGISFEHLPSGIDTMTFLVEEKQIHGREDALLDAIDEAVTPDTLTIENGISLIAVVGHGMAYKPGVAARVITSLAKAGINIRMIDQGSSELNIIIGVNDDDYAAAIRAIYEEFEG